MRPALLVLFATLLPATAVAQAPNAFAAMRADGAVANRVTLQ